MKQITDTKFNLIQNIKSVYPSFNADYHPAVIEVFIQAITNGRLEVINWIVALDLSYLDKVIYNTGDLAFIMAATNSHQHIIERLLELIPDPVKRQIMICGFANSFMPILTAAANGNLAIFQRLLELTPSNFIPQMLTLFEYKIFKQAAVGGNIEIVNTIIGLVSRPEEIEIMIHSDDDAPFYLAASSGHKDIVHRLIYLTPDPIIRSKMIKAKKNSAITWSAINGHIDLFMEFKQYYTTDELENAIQDQDYYMFKLCTSKGRLYEIKLLYDLILDPIKKVNMINALGYSSFQIATKFGYIEIMNFLIRLIPDHIKRETMIHANQNQAFKYFPCSGKTEVVDKLIELTLPENKAQMYNEGIAGALQEAKRISFEMIEVTLSFAKDKEHAKSLVKDAPCYSQEDTEIRDSLLKSEPFFKCVERRKKLFNLGYSHTQISASIDLGIEMIKFAQVAKNPFQQLKLPIEIGLKILSYNVEKASFLKDYQLRYLFEITFSENRWVPKLNVQHQQNDLNNKDSLSNEENVFSIEESIKPISNKRLSHYTSIEAKRQRHPLPSTYYDSYFQKRVLFQDKIIKKIETLQR